MNAKVNTILSYRLPTQIYVDGACRNNPGPLGCGLVVLHYGEPTLKQYGLYDGNGTNNQAELKALKEALKVAQGIVKEGNPVEVLSDSEYALNAVFKWSDNWSRNGWRTTSKKPVQNAALIKECIELLGPLKGMIQINHIEGHTGNLGNELADQLANLAIDEQETEWVTLS